MAESGKGSDWRTVREAWSRLAGPISALAAIQPPLNESAAHGLEEIVQELLGRVAQDHAETAEEWRARWQSIQDSAPIRRQEWAAGRLAVTRAIESLGDAGRRATPAYALTHSRGTALAVAAPREGILLGVGVDLEPLGRELGERLVGRILATEAELRLFSSAGLPPLAAWVLKEAAYKAQPGSQGTVLPLYPIVSIKADPHFAGAFLATLSGPKAGVSFNAWTGVVGSWRVGLAVCRAEA